MFTKYYPEDCSSKFNRNVDIYRRNYTVYIILVVSQGSNSDFFSESIHLSTADSLSFLDRSLYFSFK
jgi:hypothetical protein